MAWAAQERGIFCNVVVPENNNPDINAEILSYGAQLIEHGNDFYEAQDYCEELAENTGMFHLRQGNEPALINGIATMGLEIFEELPDVDVILMPIGGGTGCSALAKVIEGINPKVELIGVQAERMPSFYESWRKGKKVVVQSADTVAEGLAARSVFEVPYIILKDRIKDVILLSEEELLDGVRHRPALHSESGGSCRGGNAGGSLQDKRPPRREKGGGGDDGGQSESGSPDSGAD